MNAKTILVTDDEPHMRRLVQFNLAKLGHRIETANDGRAALARAAAGPIDLLIIDVVMGDFDGFATLRELRKLPGYTHLPVIMLTARGQSDTRELAEELGVNVFLTKPFSPIELTKWVRSLLGSVENKA
ncbi:MAG TPA: response regulator [Opitutaceae bacterium]